jgi:ketosteroid isomerase-like protein
MSQTNMDRFLEEAEAFNRGDMEAGSEGFAAKVVFEPQAAAMEGSSAGPGGVRTFLTGLTELYEVVQVHYDDVRDLGDRVLALGTLSTIGKGSGIEQEWPVAIVATFRDGLVTHWKDYGNKEQALAAVGLRE